ncbi:MAG: hypothetical protein RL514_2631 [Verrucomicrobiota bacterium]|jgi:hypothetical protein
MVVTTANVADVTLTAQLLHGAEAHAEKAALKGQSRGASGSWNCHSTS